MFYFDECGRKVHLLPAQVGPTLMVLQAKLAAGQAAVRRVSSAFAHGTDVSIQDANIVEHFEIHGPRDLALIATTPASAEA